MCVHADLFLGAELVLNPHVISEKDSFLMFLGGKKKSKPKGAKSRIQQTPFRTCSFPGSAAY